MKIFSRKMSFALKKKQMSLGYQRRGNNGSRLTKPGRITKHATDPSTKQDQLVEL